MKSRETKAKDLAALTESLAASKSAMVVSFTGLSVQKDQEFRSSLREAGANWNKQILAVTHSPVLISQFEASDVIAAEIIEGRTRLQRVSEIAGIDDLLSEYAAGSLYMAQMIGPQAARAGADR